MRSYIDDSGNTIVELSHKEADELQTALFAGFYCLDNAYRAEDGQTLYDLAYTLDY